MCSWPDHRRERTTRERKTCCECVRNRTFHFSHFHFGFFWLKKIVDDTHDDDARNINKLSPRRRQATHKSRVFATYALFQSILRRSRTLDCLASRSTTTVGRRKRGKSDANSKIWQRGLFSMETRSCLVSFSMTNEKN